MDVLSFVGFVVILRFFMWRLFVKFAVTLLGHAGLSVVINILVLRHFMPYI